MQKKRTTIPIIKMIPDILDIIDKTITKYVLDNKLSFEKLCSNHKYDLLDKEKTKSEINQTVANKIKLEIIDEKSLQAARNVLYEIRIC